MHSNGIRPRQRGATANRTARKRQAHRKARQATRAAACAATASYRLRTQR